MNLLFEVIFFILALIVVSGCLKIISQHVQKEFETIKRFTESDLQE